MRIWPIMVDLPASTWPMKRVLRIGFCGACIFFCKGGELFL